MLRWLVWLAVTVGAATGLTLTQNATTIWVPGPLNTSVSHVTASPAIIVANGITTSTITVTLDDAYTNPISTNAVTLTSARGAVDTISAASGASSALGVVTFAVSSLTGGAAVFSATDVTAGNVLVAQTATVTFTCSTSNNNTAWNASISPTSGTLPLTGSYVSSDTPSMQAYVTSYNCCTAAFASGTYPNGSSGLVWDNTCSPLRGIYTNVYFSQTFGISMWVLANVTNPWGTQYIVSGANANGSASVFFTNTSQGLLKIGATLNGATLVGGVLSTPRSALAAWTMVSVTYDLPNRCLNVSLNATQVASFSGGSSFWFNTTSGFVPITIGAARTINNPVLGNPFLGELFNVRFSSTTLTQAQIAAWYAQDIGPANAVYWYPSATSYTDPYSLVWNNASWYSVTGSTGTSTTAHAIAGTSSQTLYQTELDGPSNFTFSNLNKTQSFLVTLLFSENTCSSVGCRVFSVFVAGTACFPMLDVFSQSGVQYAPYNVNCVQTITNASTVEIDLVPVSGLAPFVFGIMIVPASWTNPYEQPPGPGN